MTPAEALNLACAALGSRSALARALGIKPPAVDQWVGKGRCPVERVLQVERLTGVSRYNLRPDIYGPAPSSDRHPSAVSQAGA